MKKQRRERDSWAWEIGFALSFGIPIYLSLPLYQSWWVHLVLIACYAGSLLLFGRNSAIEMGIPILIVALGIAINYPVYKKVIKIRHDRAMKQIQKNSNRLSSSSSKGLLSAVLSEGASNVQRKKT